MKKIITILTVLLLLFAVSCNMDSTTGLLQEAGKSVKKESFTIRKVIDSVKSESSTTEEHDIFLVASDEGIFVYGGTGKKITDTVGNGRIARNVIWGSIVESNNTYSWECIYYNDPQTGGDGKYYTIKSDGSSAVVYSGIKEELYIPVSTAYEKVTDSSSSTVSYETVVIYKNPEGTRNYYSLIEESKNPGSSAITEVKWTDSTSTDVYCTNVTYIGQKHFIGKGSDSKNYYFKADSSGISEPKINTNSYRAYNNNVFVTTGNVFYNVNGEKIDSGSGNSYTSNTVKTFVNSENTYIIASGVNEVYVINSKGTLEKKSCSNLTSIEVVYIAEVKEDNYINVITAESGAKCINLKDNSIDSTWK